MAGLGGANHVPSSDPHFPRGRGRRWRPDFWADVARPWDMPISFGRSGESMEDNLIGARAGTSIHLLPATLGEFPLMTHEDTREASVAKLVLWRRVRHLHSTIPIGQDIAMARKRVVSGWQKSTVIMSEMMTL